MSRYSHIPHATPDEYEEVMEFLADLASVARSDYATIILEARKGIEKYYKIEGIISVTPRQHKVICETTIRNRYEAPESWALTVTYNKATKQMDLPELAAETTYKRYGSVATKHTTFLDRPVWEDAHTLAASVAPSAQAAGTSDESDNLVFLAEELSGLRKEVAELKALLLGALHQPHGSK